MPLQPDTHTPLDASRCPLCGQPNACAAEVKRITGVAQPPCWCVNVTFSPEVLRKVPAAALNKACICHACSTGAATTGA